MSVKADNSQRRLAGTERPGEQDRPLVERFCRGERGVFALLVERHERNVARLAWRLLGWRGDVEDVVQEVFVKCLQSLPKFRNQSSFATWLTTLTINECRRRRRRSWLGRLFLRRVGSQAQMHEPADVPAEQREKSQRVREAVRGLSGKYREAVVLRYLEGMEVEEVAEAMGMSRGAVDVMLHRARERLRGKLADLAEEKS